MDRLQAELDTDIVRRACQCFHLSLVSRGSKPESWSDPARKACRQGVSESWQSSQKVDPLLYATVLEYSLVVPLVLAERERL